MIKKPLRASERLTPRDKVRLELELKEKGKYNRRSETENVIFWGTPIAASTRFIQRIRTWLWFYPDFLSKLINRTRPLGYLVLYAVLTFFSWNAVVYASGNPESILSLPKQQILYEGVIGSVSSINPLFITHNQVELDLQALTFNRLIRIDKNEEPKPELAETWAISSDNKSYTFFIRDDVKWQDGKPLTANDIIFTFETVQKLKGQDSYASTFEDVGLNKIDDFTVIFELPEENSTFMESLSVGIIPKHILEHENISDLRFSDFNKYPVGTGPFRIVENTKSKIVLTKFADYFKGEPQLDGIEYIFFADEKDAILAMKQMEIHSFLQATPNTIITMADYQVFNPQSFSIPLRQKLIYFNLRNTGCLSSTLVRQALSYATDRIEIVASISTGGEIALGPIPRTSWAFDAETEHYQYDISQANDLLENAGWTKSADDPNDPYRSRDGQTLTFKLTLLDSDTNNIIAQLLTAQWAEAGVKLIIDTQKYNKISRETIPRRDFEALLFEIETIPDPDKYNLWHSLQSDYPGLNLSGYSFERVDVILERARKETNQEQRKLDYFSFQKYIMQDMPAVYLFHPTYNFLMHKDVKGLEFENATLPQDRYLNVETWYID
ncbi:MAG: ABC transporter substrate-binding protein [Patescibacteria group bacterium]|nr:ABC transporter substrate-binding protein [Patescibacteria group bacterium]